MRYNEFSQRLNENVDIAEFIEDDADHVADSALADTLREIQFHSDHAQIPKISAEALINLVKTKPGGEAFTMDSLMNAKKNNEIIQNLVGDIKDDENGIKYVFIKPAEPNDETLDSDPDAEAVQTAPEKTVASMANRALGKRS